MKQTDRGTFTSKIGFMLAAVGAAAGLGNIWKFPYMAGAYGGSAFLIIYLISVIVLGIPLLLAEIMLGKETKTSIVGAFESFNTHKAWKGVGYLGVVTSLVILGFYSMVGGWSIYYIFSSLKYEFLSLSNSQFEQYFNQFTSNPIKPILFQIIFLMTTIFIAIKGVEKGIEKSNKILMPLLTILLLILMVRSLTLPNAMDGVNYLFQFDVSKITPIVVIAAMGQAFFSLSVGMGGMLTYGSYLPKETGVKKTVVQIALYDTLFALLVALVIFPAIFSFGVEPTAGPPLVFMTLPAIFAQLPFGHIFSMIFFILITVAAITSSVNIFEISLATAVDRTRLSRKKASVYLGLLVMVFGIPSTFSFGIWRNAKLFNRTSFELMDFFASNISLPLGGILLAIFVTYVWGTKKAIASTGFSQNGFLGKAWGFSIQYIAPLIVFAVFLHATGILK